MVRIATIAVLIIVPFFGVPAGFAQGINGPQAKPPAATDRSAVVPPASYTPLAPHAQPTRSEDPTAGSALRPTPGEAAVDQKLTICRTC